MASAKNPFGSVLGVIVIVLAIAVAAYFIMEENDSELEIDIGLLQQPVPVVAPVLAA